jgi:hypothetical protein
MKLDRRTAILGVVSTFLVDSMSTPGQDNLKGSTLTLEIPDFSTIVFSYRGKAVVFTADEIWAALKSVEVPKVVNPPDPQQQDCHWDEWLEQDVCEDIK